MNVSHPGEAAGASAEDLRALSWVQDEVRRSVEAAHKALHRYLKEADALRGSDIDHVDPSILRGARTHLHQAAGALELVGLQVPGLFLRASERAVHRLVEKPAQVDAKAIETIERASFALMDYIGRLVSGRPVCGVALFPQYRGLLELAGADRIHPADLWEHDWRWRVIGRENGIAPLAVDAQSREAMERLMLRLMRTPDRTTLRRMSDLCAGLGADAKGRRATMWRLAAGFFEAQAAGLLRFDVYIKRAAPRLLAQARLGLRSGDVSDRLANDLLFFCARALEPTTDNPAPRLQAVRQAYALPATPLPDYEASSLGLFDPAVVAQARRRVAQARDGWSMVAGGDLHRIGSLNEHFSLVQDSLVKLYPHGADLGQALLSAARDTATHSGVAAPLAMEVATAVLYLEASLEDADFEDPALGSRIQRLAQRVQSVRQGGQAQPLEPWMEELYRRVSDSQTIGSVVQELRVSLSEVEKQIDQYFRKPEERDLLFPVPGQLSAMRGVLSVLGLEPASQAVLRMRDDVDALVHATDTKAARLQEIDLFDRLADNLGALSFLIDILAVQPALAKQLFRFDAAQGRLQALMRPSSPHPAFGDSIPDTGPGDLGERAQRVGQDAARKDITDEALLRELRSLAQHAMLAEERRLAETLQAAQGALERSSDAVQRRSVRDELSARLQQLAARPEPVVPVAPAEPAKALPVAAAQPEDDEMLSVFVEEAGEVIASARDAIERLRQPERDLGHDLSEMTAIRRAFHTLKGSSRMVGMGEFGDAAWACEQLYNARLAQSPTMDAPLGALTLDALDYLEPWVRAVAERRDAGHHKAPVVAAADAMRLRGEMLAIGQAAAPAPMAVAEPAPAVVGDAPVPAAGADAALAGLMPLAAPVPTDEPVAPLQPAVGADTPGFVDPEGLIGRDWIHPSELEWGRPSAAVAPAATPADTPAPAEPEPIAETPAADVNLTAEGSAAASVAYAPTVPGIWSDEGRRASDDLETGVRDFAVDKPVDKPVDGLGIDLLEGVDLELPAWPESLPSPLAEPTPAEAAHAEAAPVALDEATAGAWPEGALDLVLDLPDLGAESAPTPEPGEPGEAGELGESVPPTIAPIVEPEGAQAIGADDWPRAAGQAEPSVTEAAAEAESGALAATGPMSIPAALDEPVKVIGPLRIGIAMFNIFLNEADELSRRLDTRVAEWVTDPVEPPGETAVVLAHSLAGSSATVGFADLSRLARSLEHALMRSNDAGCVTDGEPELYTAASDDIRRLLHQFAAGFLESPRAGLIEQLEAHEPSERAAAEMPDDAGAAGGPLAAVHRDGPAIEVEDEVDPDLFPIFCDEAEELLPQLSGRIRDWALRAGDRSAAAACMRTLHTFKGGARLAGALRVGEMAHRLETSIEDRLARDTVTSADVEPLVLQVDAIEAVFAQLRATQAAGAVPADTLPAPGMAASAVEAGPAVHGLDSLVPVAAYGAAPVDPVLPAATDTADGAGPAPQGEQPPTALSAGAQTAASSDAGQPANPEAIGAAVAAATGLAMVAAGTAAAAAAAPAPTPGPAVDWARFAGTSAPTATAGAPPAATAGAVRVQAPLLDRLVNHAGEVSIARTRIESDLGQFKSSLADLTENLERLRRQLRDIEVQAESQISSRLEAAKAAALDFDPLEMDRYTRVQELTRMMAESVNDVATVQRGLQRALQSTEDHVAQQARLTRSLQDDLLRTRMVEFESLSERLFRVVRQATKDSGKQVRLDIVGGQLEIDRGVLERMTAPFEHLLRNSIIHGIERPDLREAAGKDPVGSVQIRLEPEGNEVAIELSDDGTGLQRDRIRERAVALGLLGPEESLSESRLIDLVFSPGFSTAEELTEMAGRGVGMDVVRSEVLALGGRIQTTSTPGQGTRFRMVLPLTTAVTQVVMLRCGDTAWAVPSTLIELVRRENAAEVEQAYLRGTWKLGAEEVPFHWLAALLDGEPAGHASGRSVPVVLVRSASQRVALHVDEVLGNQEVVVKNLGPQLARLPGLAGMTLLPSGAVAPIYNPVALAALYGAQARQRWQQQAAAASAPTGAAPVTVAAPLPPLVLVVDDSLTVRRITQRMLTREGYRVVTAKDGLDGLERLADERPQVILSDIEMPRMDGFDFVRNLRADPRSSSVPVIMITSRIAQKHRDYAFELGVQHYLGKPYSEEELLKLVGQLAPLPVSASAS